MYLSDTNAFIYYLSVDASDRYLCFEAIDINGNMIDFFEIGNRPQNYDYCKCTSDADCDGKLHRNSLYCSRDRPPT